MSPASCDVIRPFLGEFVDDELTGVEMLRVSRHLGDCPTCASEVATLRQIGAGVRRAGQVVQWPDPDMDGLGAGVVSRTRAELALSWRATARRATEDWHWVIVGGGSVAATFVSMVAAAALLLFGPAPVRSDSLSALVRNLDGPAGMLLVEASRAGDDGSMMLVRVDSAPGGEASSAVLPTLAEVGERHLVGELADRVSADTGLVELSAMSAADRRYTESLLDQISQLRLNEPTPGASGALTIHRVRLLMSTEVSAKGLN